MNDLLPPPYRHSLSLFSLFSLFSSPLLPPPIDISIAIPEGTYARIAPRSGLAWKNSIDVGAGVVDYDYR